MPTGSILFFLFAAFSSFCALVNIKTAVIVSQIDEEARSQSEINITIKGRFQDMARRAQLVSDLARRWIKWTRTLRA